MPHGYPDWGRDDPGELLYGLPDMAELAVRLGSPDSHDRHGHVMWLENFESGVDSFEHDTLFAGDTVTWDATTARSGGFSCRLHVSNVMLAYSAIRRYLAYPVLGCLGTEFSFATEEDTHYIYLYAWLDNGIDIYHATVRYRPDINELAIEVAPAVYQIVDANRAIHFERHAFNTVKLVVDWVNMQYVRLIFNNQVYDVSPYAPYLAIPSVAPSLMIEMRAWRRVAGVTDTYIDDVIVTQHEP